MAASVNACLQRVACVSLPLPVFSAAFGRWFKGFGNIQIVMHIRALVAGRGSDCWKGGVLGGAPVLLFHTHSRSHPFFKTVTSASSPHRFRIYRFGIMGSRQDVLFWNSVLYSEVKTEWSMSQELKGFTHFSCKKPLYLCLTFLTSFFLHSDCTSSTTTDFCSSPISKTLLTLHICISTTPLKLLLVRSSAACLISTSCRVNFCIDSI